MILQTLAGKNKPIIRLLGFELLLYFIQGLQVMIKNSI